MPCFQVGLEVGRIEGAGGGAVESPPSSPGSRRTGICRHPQGQEWEQEGVGEAGCWG